jgi:hypothetical protein
MITCVIGWGRRACWTLMLSEVLTTCTAFLTAKLTCERMRKRDEALHREREEGGLEIQPTRNCDEALFCEGPQLNSETGTLRASREQAHSNTCTESADCLLVSRCACDVDAVGADSANDALWSNVISSKPLSEVYQASVFTSCPACGTTCSLLSLASRSQPRT